MRAPAKSRTPNSASDGALLAYFHACRSESEQAKINRMKQNRLNWDMYFGYQDYSYKQDGQSTEFLPKMANAAENMRAFVKRALVAFGDWFSVDVPKGSPLTPEQVRTLLRRYIDNVLTSRTGSENFSSLMGKATLQGLFESLVVLKVHGYSVKEQTYIVEPGNLLAGIPDTLSPTEQKVWRLRIDLIPTEDYYPDPTGRKLYEIHEVERDYVDVLAMVDAGIYDKSVVEKLDMDFTKDAEQFRRLARHRGQNETTAPRQRRRVKISEMWGTILDNNGRPTHDNIVMTVANDKYIVRQPTKNPMWHGESPLVAASIVNVPHAVWGKAFYDHTAKLNIAVNELFNLILDGGLAAVWGIRELRMGYLEDETQVSNGIPQGTTLMVKDDIPAGQTALTMTKSGQVPPDAMNVLNLVTREHDASAMTNDTRMGFLSPRQVKATEIHSADASNSMLLDSFSGDLEVNLIEPTLRKSWLTILQFADDLDKGEVIDAIGVDAAFELHTMGAPRRFAMFAKGMKFQVHGLSATLARSRDFQKLMAFMQGVSTNPILMESFMRKMNGDKAIESLLRSLNINPESFELTPEELKQSAQRMANVQQMQTAIPGGSPPAQGANPSMQSSIAQDAEPSGGLGT